MYAVLTASSALCSTPCPHPVRHDSAGDIHCLAQVLTRPTTTLNWLGMMHSPCHNMVFSHNINHYNYLSSNASTITPITVSFGETEDHGNRPVVLG